MIGWLEMGESVRAVPAELLIVQFLFCRLNGVPACANKKLLTNILRNEWNFTGYVISDDDAMLFAISEHHYFDNKIDAAAGGVKAGCNLELTDTDGDWVYSSIPKVSISDWKTWG